MALFYTRVTWFLGTLAFNLLSFALYEAMWRPALQAFHPVAVLQVLVAAAAIVAGASFLLWRTSGSGAAVRGYFRTALCWGLNDCVFMYGIAAASATGFTALGYPFFAVSVGLSLWMFPKDVPAHA